VPHLHVHLVPRYAVDPRPEWPFPFPEQDPPPFPDEQMRADVARLQVDVARRS
jgi:diadenosine tetraphosphate (Ap4A) HIT family hydrolase